MWSWVEFPRTKGPLGSLKGYSPLQNVVLFFLGLILSPLNIDVGPVLFGVPPGLTHPPGSPVCDLEWGGVESWNRGVKWVV